MVGKKLDGAVQDLIDRMEAARKHGEYDPERGHGEADDILTDAVRLLDSGLAKNLIAKYNRVKKWYA